MLLDDDPFDLVWLHADAEPTAEKMTAEGGDADLLEACIQSALSTADQDKERQAEEAMSKQHTAEEQMR